MLARAIRQMACTLIACMLATAALASTIVVSDCNTTFTSSNVTDGSMQLWSNKVQVTLNETLDYTLTGETTLDLPQGSFAIFDHALRNDAPIRREMIVWNYIESSMAFNLDNLDVIRSDSTGTAPVQSRQLVTGKPFWMEPGETLFFNINGVVPDGVETGKWSAFSVNAGPSDHSSVVARVDRVRVRNRTPGTGLFVEKTVSRAEAEVGQTVDYTIRIKNISDATFPATWLKDVMPVGFTYLPGTLRINDVKKPDPKLEKNIFLIDVARISTGNVCVVKYRVRIGPEALGGDGVNRVQALMTGYQSNVATAAVHVTEGAFNSKGVAIGRVYLDKNKNGRPDAGETGVPGVRLYIEDGTSVVTDADGKYSFYGLRSTTHVIKLDSTTLPEGSTACVTSQNQARHGLSRFLKLRRYQLQKANFALSFNDDTLAEIRARRAFLCENESEIAREVRSHITPDGSLGPIADPKSLPSAGVIKPLEDPGMSSILKITAQSAAATHREGSFAPLQPVLTNAPDFSKDTALTGLDNKLGFVGFVDGAILPSKLTTLRVKGPQGATFSLAVNGEIIGDDRIGTKASIPNRQVELWEFVGLSLHGGKNRLRLTMIDPFGNVRGTETINLIAPGDLAYIKVSSLREKPVADGATPAMIQIELLDAMGTPVTARTPLTLEASLGQFRADDLDPGTPGTQIFVEGGKASVPLLPPTEPGESVLNVSSGLIKQELDLAFLPNLRPMLAVGVVEGALHLGSGNRSGIFPVGSRDTFEEELRGLTLSTDDGRLGASGRAAFFLKGKIRGDYLLTAAYDSDKPTQERLFRDIQPGEFYPVYGDSSTRSYDAQSTSKLYVRIDRNRGYLLIGDFTTQTLTADENDSRALGNYQRSLTGVREHFENKRVRANLWVSNDSTRQVIKEVLAKGISGPYVFDVPGMRENSERVEIIVRDRDQPSHILEIHPQTRFYDYEFEPFTGELIFKAPVPSLDPNLNPISIRMTCELETGGDKFWTYGADADVKLTKSATASAGFVRNEDPQNIYQLASAGTAVKVGANTTLIGEVAQSTSALKGDGLAERFDVKHQDTKLAAHGFIGRADDTFINPASILLPGRIEGGIDFSYKLTSSTTLRGKGLLSQDLASDARREGLLVEIERALGRWKLDVGTRFADQIGVAESAVARRDNSVESLRGKVTAPLPKLKNAHGYLEYEQDITDADKQLAAVGLDYQLKSNGRLYARHEFISSLGGPFELNEDQSHRTTVVGLEHDYMKGGHMFDEYRASNEIDGREAEAATGLRNLWRVSETLQARTSFEQVTPVAGSDRNRATAVTGAIEYAPKSNWRADARLEYRRSASVDTILSTFSYAKQINGDWTFLGKSVLLLTESKRLSGGHAVQSRIQSGFAWRPENSDRWNALGKYELKYETDSRSTAQFAERVAHIVTDDINYQPIAALTLTGHLAAKWIDEKELGFEDTHAFAYLVGGSATWELPHEFELSLNTYALTDHATRQTRYAVGPELGFNIAKNFEVGLGYNFTGFRDPDLVTDGTTAKGVFVRFRLKFDETSRLRAKKDDKS